MKNISIPGDELVMQWLKHRETQGHIPLPMAIDLVSKNVNSGAKIRNTAYVQMFNSDADLDAPRILVPANSNRMSLNFGGTVPNGPSLYGWQLYVSYGPPAKTNAGPIANAQYAYGIIMPNVIHEAGGSILPYVASQFTPSTNGTISIDDIWVTLARCVLSVWNPGDVAIAIAYEGVLAVGARQAA